MSDPLAEPAFTLRSEDTIDRDGQEITLIYPTLRQPDTYRTRGYKFFAVLQDHFAFQTSETTSLEFCVRGCPVGESRPAMGRNGNVYVPTRPIRAELASTMKNLMEHPSKFGHVPMSFRGVRAVMARFVFFYPEGINRTRIADTDNITKMVKDAIEMAGLVSNDVHINDEHAVRLAGQSSPGSFAHHFKQTGGIFISLHTRVDQSAILIE